jgi:nucleoid-associated protein YgaU
VLEDSAPVPVAPNTVTPVARTQGQNHVVVGENDSYWALSKRVYGTPSYFHALAKYNSSRIKDPNRLKAGMKVLTPERQELEALFPHLVSGTASGGTAAQDVKSGLSWDVQGVPSYRVGESDTLTGIAQAHLGRASRWVQIYEMNRKVVSDPKTLRPGTVLRLPADASRVRLVPQG